MKEVPPCRCRTSRSRWVTTNTGARNGGTLLRQVLAAGLLDELELHIAPVLLGDGMRLFDASLGLDTREGIELTPVRVIETPEVTHIRYTVGSRAKLELDDRGSGGS